MTRGPYSTLSTTPSAPDAPQVFEITHPFHPLRGRSFEVFSIHNNWGQWRVFFMQDHDQGVRSLPLAWTSLAPADPFVTIAAGRALFRYEDLHQLVLLCEVLHG